MGGAADDCNEHICSNDKDEKQLKEVLSKSASSPSGVSLLHSEFRERPLNAIDLGKSTWPLLHRFTLGYPEHPTEEQKKKALMFIQAFSKIYPCKVCAIDFQQKIKDHPPRLENKESLVLWMCE